MLSNSSVSIWGGGEGGERGGEGGKKGGWRRWSFLGLVDCIIFVELDFFCYLLFWGGRKKRGDEGEKGELKRGKRGGGKEKGRRGRGENDSSSPNKNE